MVMLLIWFVAKSTQEPSNEILDLRGKLKGGNKSS